jgi:signal transduction histidine kinase
MSENRLNIEKLQKELIGFKRIGFIFGSTLAIDKILQLVVEEICDLLDADRGTLFLIDQGKRILWSKIALKAEISEITLPIGKGIAGYVGESGEVVNIQDAYNDPRFNPEVDKKTGYRTKSILCAPLRKPTPENDAKEEIIGVIQLLNKKSDEGFTNEDEDLILSLGGMLAILLQNARLYNDLQEQYQRLELLYEAEQIISGTDNLEILIDSLLELYLKKFGIQKNAILLKEQQGYVAFWKSAEKKSEIVIQNLLVLPNDFPMNEQNPFSMNVDHFDLNSPTRKLFHEQEWNPEDIFAVPLKIDEEIVGYLLFEQLSNEMRKNSIILELLRSQIIRGYQLYQSRKELLDSQRMSMLGTMMSGIVHDLKSPLNNIKGYADLMTDEDTTPEERKEYKEIIDREIETMVSMSNEILDYAKGKRNILPRKIGVMELMIEFEKKIQIPLEQYGVHFIKENIEKGVVRVDRDKILRAFVNIAKNAIEALGTVRDRQRTFTCWVDKQDNWFIFHFRDNGPGIPEEIQAKLFSRFATARKKGGTGLGLMNVKNIIEEHGGRIDFLTQKDVGTEFMIYIPEYHK